MPSSADLKDAGTVSRVLQLLRLVAESDGPFTLTSVCARTGLTPSTVHRLLDLLQREGFVQKDPVSRAHRIGGEFFRVAALVYNKVPFRDIAQPILRDAAAALDETCYFALYLPSEGRLAFVEKVDSSHPLNYRVELNRPFSLVWGSSGRAILAHLPAADAQALVARETERNHAGLAPPAWETLGAELAQIRRMGYAHSHGQRIPDAFGVVAPVFDHRDKVYGALGFTIPSARFGRYTVAHIADVTMAHARALSLALGASGAAWNAEPPPALPAARPTGGRAQGAPTNGRARPRRPARGGADVP